MVIELEYKPDAFWCELVARNVATPKDSKLLDKDGDVGSHSSIDDDHIVYYYEIVKTDITWDKHFQIALEELDDFDVKGLYSVPALGLVEVPFRQVIEAARDDYRRKREAVQKKHGEVAKSSAH